MYTVQTGVDHAQDDATTSAPEAPEAPEESGNPHEQLEALLLHSEILLLILCV